MSHWNHRVVRREYPESADPEEQVLLGIHETYYDVGDGPLPMFTEEPIRVMETSVEALRETLQRMLAALDKPVLDYKTREEITP